MKPALHKALIIDDEEHCRNALQNLILRYCPQLQVTGNVGSVFEARQNMIEHRPDLIFLDVEMPEENGFDLLEQLGAGAIPVIFTTAYERYALPALKKQAIDYLLKPVESKELIAAINKLKIPQLTSPREPGKIALPTLKGLIFSSSQDIIHCQADGSYTRVFQTKGSLLVSRNIGQIEDLLAPHGFFRVHKSHLVNLRHVKEYIRGKGGLLVMSDGVHVEVSKRKREDFLLAVSN